MRGRYNRDSRRIFTSSGYIFTIGIVIAIAISLVMLLLVFLPVVDDTIEEGRTIVSITNQEREVGLYNDPANIYCTVHYSDGSSEEVRLKDMIAEGLNTSKLGTQNVSLNYGGFEQTITFEVKDINCILQYESSLGGRIQGEALQGVANGSDAATVIAIPETGYVFEEWNDGFPYPTRKDKSVHKNATYVARFRKAKYTVRFYYFNGTVAVEEQVSYGETPTKMPNPDSDPEMKRYGYTFSNWIPAEFSSIDRDMVIHPEYVKTATDVEIDIPTDIYGNSMGTTDLNEYGFYEYGEMATITATPFNSRRFAYWLIETSSGSYERLDAEGTGAYTVGSLSSSANFTSTKLGNNQYILSFRASENINKVRIKAIFAYEESTIKFVNNQSPDGNKSYVLFYGNPIGSMIENSDFFTIDKGPGEAVGMKFLGWFAEGTNTEITAESTFEQPTTVIARWEKRVYMVRFFFDGIDYVYDKSVYVQYQNTLASATSDTAGTNICGIPTEIPQKEHYIFIGWQNAITQEVIDDKTKVVVNHLYLDVNGNPTGDFANRIITMTPIFSPIKHKLTVMVQGAGAVNLHVKEGLASTSPEYTIREINVMEIREDFIYTITFEASVGYALKRVLWTNIDGTNITDYSNNEDNVTLDLNVLGDNDIIIEFDHKKFDINIAIDESIGGIKYLDAFLQGDGTNINIKVDYNASINLIVGVVNAEYAIENIMVDGEYLRFENGDFMGADLSEYTLNIEEIKQNTNIEINYKSNSHKIATPQLSLGSIKLTSIYNPTVTTDITTEENEYVHGTQNVYRIATSQNGYYISGIKINGYTYDLYNSGKPSLVYHNWYINQVASQITVLEILGSYYYHYGDFVFNGKTYAYCQTVSSTDGNVETTVFEVSLVGGNVTYSKIIDTAIINAGYTELQISSRDIYSTIITKDMRITALDLMLKVDMNYSIDVTFMPIDYEVSAEINDGGTVSTPNSRIPYNGEATVVATPNTGYYIYGYTINGETFVADLPEPTASLYLRFKQEQDNDNRIKEDKHISFIYKKIQVRVNIKNTTTYCEVYLDDILLNSSIDKTIYYNESASYEITIYNSNYRISSIRIIKNGDDISEEYTHYNMTSYTLTFNDTTENIDVEITCAPITSDVSEAATTYTLEADISNIQNITYSSQYKVADTTQENELIVIANVGYFISSVILSGNQGNSYSEDYVDTTALSLSIPANTFVGGEVVNVLVVSHIRQFNIDTTVIGGSDLDFVKLQSYGASVDISIQEVANHYISSFKIDGNEISFDSNNWTDRDRNNDTKKYTSGIYRLTVTKDTSIYLEYSLNEYSVTLDSNSINGNTMFSSRDPISGVGKAQITKIKHGENLIINLTAIEGYHIKNLYINNTLVNDLGLNFTIENNNTETSYIYEGVSANIVVKAVYEINRYSFTYEIQNISENFANYDFEPGTLTTENNILAAGDEYTGIEYGRNFYINAIPSTLNGYYLVSIFIKYGGNDLTILAGENKLISSRGGMIYFNTMLDFNEGIRQDIELIRLTFNKYTYNISLQQESEEHTGQLNISYTHPNSGTDAVTLFGDNGHLYYYLPESGNICTKVSNIYVPTDFVLTYNSEDGGYYYIDSNSQVYNLKIEHGIRYNVNATPAIGYKRTHFILNGNNVNSSVNNNNYSVNIVRDTSISVAYTILTYNVNFSLKIADKNLTGRIPDSQILNYATISIVDFSDQYYPITYQLDPNTSYINKVFDYGTKVKFVMTPKFSTTGYYLYNMYYKEREITTFEGDVRDTVIYGGSQGITLTSDISAIANFRITRYNISTSIQYLENITGESANTLVNEGTSTVAWGDTATIKVANGNGYELGEIYVKRGNDNPIFVTLNPTEEQLSFDLQKYVKNDYSVTNGIRDIVMVRQVTNDIIVIAKFIRKAYSVNFNFTNINFLDSIDISLNKYNHIYPATNNVSGAWNNTTYIVSAKYYDELSGIITPKNGYEIMQNALALRAVYWDESSISYKPIKDNNGNDIIHYIPLTSVAGDVLSFTFHEATKVIADLNVQSDLIVDLTVRIKTYTVKTTINRDSSASDLPNNTAVSMSVKTQTNQNVRVNNVAQVAQNFTISNLGKIYYAEHHGYIEYTFDAPEGYMLGNIFVNGINWDESILKASNYQDSYIKMVATKVVGANNFYRYVITMYVNDLLIEGSPNYVVFNDMSDLTVELKIKLITYDIKTLINGNEYDSVIMNNKNTFTDNKTLKVVTPNDTNHYNFLNIAPEVSEGYKITNMNMSIYSEGVFTDIGYAFNVEQSNTLQMINTNLKYVDVLKDNLVLYICYTTEIKKYNVDIFAYAYSIDMWVDQTEGKIGYDSDAGVLNVSALTNDIRTNVTTAYDHEYFSVLTAMAYAKENYIMYSIQEYIGTSKPSDWLASDNWTEVKDGVRGITYGYETKPNGTIEYSFEYSVDDYGDRAFRVVFRQQTTVTINVINPYRVTGTQSGGAKVGNINYKYYPEIIARIGGVEIPNSFDNGTYQVVDTYVYKVNVGSVIVLDLFYDGNMLADMFGIYYMIGDQYIENTEISTTGFEIRAKWDFYLKDKTKLYITYQKETNASSPTAIGGELLFGLDGDDMVSDTNSTVYREATVTQTVTILVEPYENYIFTALKVRQIDQEASRNAGKIVYIQGAGEWLTYNASNFESLDTNGFIITQGMTPAGNTTYTIIMTGNMELSFVFYKTYNIVYSSNYSDVGYVNNITLKDNNINNNLCDELDVVSYDSAFTLIAPQPDPDLYQFMGWYVNGVNVYKYLSTRYPDSNRFTNLFEINGSSMNLTYNNVELDNIIITALYQRIINVSLINELYYYDTATMHWNSWTTGAIRTQYYDYVSTQGLPIAKTIENLNNRTASTISTIIGSSNTTYNLIKDEIGGTPVGNDTYWNTLSTIPAGFDINTIKAYSSSTFFKVLYQNVTNEDYVNDTWENSDIELILTGLPNTVRLQAWQYYNWVSGKYEDIGYSYNDPSGLIDSLGNEIVIDCTNTEYNFNLGYIYSESMPGAINSSTGEVRPLIIRPFLRKVVSVALDKLTYIDYLGGNSETDFTSQVGPSIDGLDIVFPQTNNFYNLGSPYQYISDDNCSAEFDYGAKINIRSYCNIESETGLPLYNTEDENFRFVGWFMNWEVNGIARYRYILDMNGGVNKADENYPIYLAYAFGEEPPEDDTIQYRAVYINQYEHKVYSYNIAGGETYQDAFNGGQYSFKDAPAINRNSLSINTQAISFASYDTSQTGNNRAGITELSYNLEILSDESETHKLEFYIDIGCIYSFNMDMSYINRVANYVSNNQYSTPYGYDPAYDKQHKIKFSDDVANEKEEDYLNALAGNYIFSGVNASNPIDSNIQVSKHLQIDIQYVSQVKLIFKKLMWKAGITLPYNLSNYLLPGNHSLTIWDYYTKFYSGYGDTVNNTPDGTVHTYFRLKPGQYTNFYNDGVFKYVPYGFKDGQGIPLNKLVYYVNTGNNNQTLFNPGVPQYRRHVEIDLTTYIDGGPLLFGDPNYSGDPYSTSNTGEGTSASPYRIFTARQLKNINMFWYYNEFSCVNTLGHATNFKLFNNINLQGLDESSSTTPYTLANGTITEAWMPMCYARDESPNGFDGILEGNNKYVYGLAAYGRAGGNLPDTSDTSNAPDHERYDYTFGYGIFGLIKGGTVKNLKVGNAYIDVASLISGGASTTDKPANVGILAAVIEDATITNITFDENIEIGRYGAYRIYLNAGTGTNGIGILAGLVKNSIITTVVLDVYNSAVSAAQPNISINGENAGGLIGSIIDDYHAVPSLNIGNVASLISNLTIKSTSYKSIQSYPKILINTTGTQKYSGGVIGYMEAQSGIVIGTRVNKTNYVDNFVVFEIGNSSSIYTGGVIGRLKTGTLKDTRILSNGKSKYQIAETGETTILNQDYGGVGGIAGYNSGTITNVTVNRAPGTATPFTYTYTEGILGFFFLYGPIAGGIAGINNVQATPYVDSEDPRNNVIIISGEISGFRSVAGSEVTIYAPYVRKGSIGIVSGAKGGIVGFNKMGALIDDCSFGDSSMAVAGSDKDRYLYVYDENSSNSQNNNDDIFDHSTKNGNVGMVSYLPGNLYVGGIAGASRGAIYNSYVAKREIFVKYYNAIANNPFKWNVFVGGICGGQNFDNDELAMISQPNSYEATKETIVSHPNVYTALQFINYDWNDNNGIMNDEIMKTSLAQRSKIQSCYTSDIILNLGIYIWCDNNDYKAGQADTEAENPQTSEYNYVGERQNVSVGGILGYNNNTTGSSSVNHCYSFGNNFSVKLAAYGATNSSTSQYATNVGYYYYKNTFDILSLWDDYFTNRIGTNLAVNIKGIVGGKAPDVASVATYCWTYGNFVNNEKLRSTGSLDSIPSDQTGDYEGSNSHHRRIGFIDGEVDPDAIATSGGYFYHAPSKMLDINLDKFWGYEDPGDGITNTLFNRFIMTSIAGFVGWKENPDGRIYRTDAQTGMPMVWHSDLRPDGNADIIKWYTIASFGMGWYALGGDYFAASYTSAVNDFPNFLEAYLVGGQIKYSEQ